MKKILLGLTGSIAGIKAYDIIRGFQDRGIEVQCMLSSGGEVFVSRVALEAISQYRVLGPEICATDSVKSGNEIVTKKITKELYSHIYASREVDAIVIAPASANSIARLAHGNADDFLLALCLARDINIPVLMAPAMNHFMWESEAVQENIMILRNRGWNIIPPQSDEKLACGEVGEGKMATVSEIIISTERACSKNILEGKTVVINSGGTRSYLDPVRFVGNESSGYTGALLAELCFVLGAKKIYALQANSKYPVPNFLGIVHSVQTAEQMDVVFRKYSNEADICIFSAAVSDFRVVDTKDIKIKKQREGELYTLSLLPEIDIAEQFGYQKKAHQTSIGFALETPHSQGEMELLLRAKANKKNFDILIGNTPKSFENTEAEFWIYTAKDDKVVYHNGEKKGVLQKMLENIDKIK